MADTGQGGEATGIPGFYAVVPAGGSGTRLWPLSRRSSPKFLHDLTGSGQSLLQETAARLQPLCAQRLIVVTGQAHAAAVRASLPSLSVDLLLVEPSPRDSLPAIGLAAAMLQRRDPEAVLGSFAADHVITDHEVFARCVGTAVRAARDGHLVTLGITPNSPATGFGYLKVGAAYHQSGQAHGAHLSPASQVQEPGVAWVEEFVEKPSAELAARYVEAGHLWNAGMFVVQARVLMDMIEREQPDVAAGLRAIAADPGAIDSIWPRLPALSIDHAIAEPAARQGEVVVVPAGFGWDDIGDFASLADHASPAPGQPGLRILGDQDLVISADSSGVIAPRGGRTVVVLGVPDAVVIDTPDAILITTKDRVQDVKTIVGILSSHGREDLT